MNIRTLLAITATTTALLSTAAARAGTDSTGYSANELADPLRGVQTLLRDLKGGYNELEGLAKPEPFPVSALELLNDKLLRDSDFRLQRPLPGVLAKLRERLTKEEEVRVIVTLRSRMGLAGKLGADGLRRQQDEYGSLQGNVLNGLRGLRHQLIHRYEVVPQMALKVDAAALDALARHPDVAKISEDEMMAPSLASSGAIVGVPDALDRGYNGANRVVAVLDSGIERSHPFLRGFVGEACFSDECPNGDSSQVGLGAAAACTFSSRCDHGTHVSGIAIGIPQVGSTDAPGVGSGAKLMPINVFSPIEGSTCEARGQSSPCLTSYTSDLLAALQYVFGKRNTYPLSAVNMSLGGGKHTSFCDDSDLKPIIDHLRSVGIATVIASGNDSYANAISSPACISSAIPVGATDDADMVASFSNSVGHLEFLAPGVDIVSACFGGMFCSKQGTSMAAPHVAGAWAVMHQQGVRPVSEIVSLLIANGRMVTDTRAGANNRSKPRIQVAAALQPFGAQLQNAKPHNYRSPIPYRHHFHYLPAHLAWSAVGVRAEGSASAYLSLYENAPNTSNRQLLRSSTIGGGAVNVIAQYTGDLGRPRTYDYPEVSMPEGSTTRYNAELSDDAWVLNTNTPGYMPASSVLRVYSYAGTAGKAERIRVIPSGNADLELMVFEADPSKPYLNVQGRLDSKYVASSAGAGQPETVLVTPAKNGQIAVVVTQKSGSGNFSVHRDASSPFGSVQINSGAASTANRLVTLNLSASDPETGIDAMRICADGNCDTETWVPYATTASVRLPISSGTATVKVFYRNRAGMTSPAYTDSILVTARPVQVTIDDASGLEGDYVDGKLRFAVRLSEPAWTTTLVRVKTEDGDAGSTAANLDYYNKGEQELVFAPGQSQATYTVSLATNLAAEPNETMTARIVSVTASQISDGEATGTILDDDRSDSAVSYLRVGCYGDTEPAAAGGTTVAEALVILSKPTAQAISVPYFTLNGSAVVGQDYAGASGSVSWAAGQGGSRTVKITLLHDAIKEGKETFSFGINPPAGVAVEGTLGECEIYDND